MQKNFQKLSANQTAFTLIELLIVISIIGLLASIILVSLNSARSKARDAKRAGDMKQMQTALELYYNDNNAFPSGVYSSTGYQNAFTSLPLSAYVTKIPVDPTNVAGQYGYYYAGGYKPTGANSFTSTGSGNDFILATRFENANTTGAVPTFGGWDNGNLNYLSGE